MNQQPQPRRVRRVRGSDPRRIDPTKLDLPAPLRFLTNPKLFLAMGVAFAAAIIVSLFAGAIGIGNRGSGHSPIRQANELADVRRTDEAASETPAPATTPVAVKRYNEAPRLVIDPAKRYVATITTTQGDIRIELYPDQALEAVNAFIFLARDGYYSGTPFMQIVKNPDGSKFYAQAGDPTRTGLGTPGFSIKKEQSSRPFAKGAVGMGGSSPTSNGGQFFISFGDYPALNGKYTIFGQVVAGLDVLERLSLLDLTQRDVSTSAGDEIQSVVVTES